MPFNHTVIFHRLAEENRFPMLFRLGDDVCSCGAGNELLLMFHSAPVRRKRRHMGIAMRAGLIRSCDGGRS